LNAATPLPSQTQATRPRDSRQVLGGEAFYTFARWVVVLLLLGMHWFYGSSLNAHFEQFTHKGGTVIHLILAIVLFRGMRIFEAWWRQFPPQQHRWHSFWRNSAIMFAIVMLPLVFLVILLYTN